MTTLWRPPFPLPPTTCCVLFFFNDTATTEIYTLSLHDALPICEGPQRARLAHAVRRDRADGHPDRGLGHRRGRSRRRLHRRGGSGEHTSELQSPLQLVFPLFLLKKKKRYILDVSSRQVHAAAGL